MPRLKTIFILKSLLKNRARDVLAKQNVPKWNEMNANANFSVLIISCLLLEWQKHEWEI